MQAIILAGGGGRRLGGTLKPAIEVGGVRMLDRVIAALAGADPIVVVGPETLAVPPDVLRVQETPIGGGPVAAIGAAFDRMSATDLTAVVAGDLPLLRRRDVRRLADAVTDDGAVYVDETGRAQWLCGVWRTAALAVRLEAFAHEHGELANGSLRALLAQMRFAEIRVAAGGGLPPFFDCDTQDDIRRAEKWLRKPGIPRPDEHDDAPRLDEK